MYIVVIDNESGRRDLIGPFYAYSRAEAYAIEFERRLPIDLETGLTPAFAIVEELLSAADFSPRRLSDPYATGIPHI
jgi:hypothetical protein